MLLLHVVVYDLVEWVYVVKSMTKPDLIGVESRAVETKIKTQTKLS